MYEQINVPVIPELQKSAVKLCAYDKRNGDDIEIQRYDYKPLYTHSSFINLLVV